MASQRVEKHFGVLEYLKDLSSSEQKKFIAGASCELLKTISEICLNLLKGTIELKPGDLNKLKKYKTQIVSLSKRKPSTKQRRQICMQKGGFIGSLLSLVVPSIISAIVTATQR